MVVEDFIVQRGEELRGIGPSRQGWMLLNRGIQPACSTRLLDAVMLQR